MAFEKAVDILELAQDMQLSRVGISLQDIQDKFKISKRTAQRMRDAIKRLFPQMEENPTDENFKRWRIPSGSLNKFVAFSADEIADLESTLTFLKRENLHGQLKSLQNIEKKVRLLLDPINSRRIEPDVDALMEAERIAMRPGPRPLMSSDIIDSIRHSIKACAKIRVRYRKRRTEEIKNHVLLPYGFILGHRHYLIARIDHPKADKYLPFSIANIEDVKILDEQFNRDPSFSLQEYAERSFGIFQEEPFEVELRFTPTAAIHAKEYIFHPTQIMEEGDDGYLDVRFRAGGLHEMIWHLYSWGDNVEVIKPKELANEVNPYRRNWKVFP